MAGYRVILFLAVTVLTISEIRARPRVTRDVLAEFENSYDAMNKNEELFNFPNDYEDEANDYKDDTNDYEDKTDDYENIPKAAGCNTPTGGWFC
jgi:hypothetical protein